MSFTLTILPLGVPGSSEVKDLPANAGDARDTHPILRSGRCPGRKWQPTPVFFAWITPWTEEPGRATVHGVAKNWTRPSTHKHILPLSLCNF